MTYVSRVGGVTLKNRSRGGVAVVLEGCGHHSGGVAMTQDGVWPSPGSDPNHSGTSTCCKTAGGRHTLHWTSSPHTHTHTWRPVPTHTHTWRPVRDGGRGALLIPPSRGRPRPLRCELLLPVVVIVVVSMVCVLVCCLSHNLFSMSPH